MVIRTRRQVWFFAVTVTIIALAAAEILNFAFYPKELLAYTMPGTAAIVVLITVPICLWIGAKMQENTALSLRLEYLLTRDRMTGLATREYFFAVMQQQSGVVGVILMIDVDHFKRVNDTYGHLAGDEVIKAVAAVLRQRVRGDDLVCRFGGEEFLVFLPETTMAEAFDIAEQLRISVAETSVLVGAHPISVSASIGGALKHRAVNVQTALMQADRALYRAKDHGRNRTNFAETPRISPPEVA